jgi:hypothetical protein
LFRQAKWPSLSAGRNKGGINDLSSIRKTGGTIAFKIAVLFLLFGSLSIVFSVYSKSQVLAFVGLGLTFWGALFLLVRPLKYVEGALLDSVAASEYSTIDRIITSFEYKGKGYYVPPYPKDVHLPQYLKGLKDMVVFLSAETDFATPSIEEMAEGKFLLTKSKGVLVAPPGLGLLAQVEKQLRQDFTKMKLEEVCEVLPRFLTQDFNLAKSMEMTLSENEVNLTIIDSLYQSLYQAENNWSSVALIGCPIVSVVACALAKSSGKFVTIHKQLVSPDGMTIIVGYRFVQG